MFNRKKPERWVISADSHVIEPHDLWQKAIGRKWGAKAPHLVGRHKGVKSKFFFTGYEYIRIDEIVEGDAALQAKLVASGTDPSVRVACMDEDGVWAEIVNATWTLYGLRIPNDDLARDVCAVFNDWLADYCKVAPKRLYGTAMVHMQDIDWACRELERAHKLGLKSVLINCDTRPQWKPYQDRSYDRFWARAEELDMPVTLHIITGNVIDLFTLHGERRINIPRYTLNIFEEASWTLGNEFIFGGILDRFPKLKLILSEYEVSWLPHWLFRMRQLQKNFMPAMHMPPIKRPIDAYMSQVHHGLIDDPLLGEALEHVDRKTVMWGSDFPHARCTYPNTHKIIGELYGHLDKATRDDITLYNAARFYGFELPKSQAA
jgi:predicted TIM-barrel fold metal-dependent hydrolase